MNRETPRERRQRLSRGSGDRRRTRQSENTKNQLGATGKSNKRVSRTPEEKPTMRRLRGKKRESITSFQDHSAPEVKRDTNKRRRITAEKSDHNQVEQSAGKLNPRRKANKSLKGSLENAEKTIASSQTVKSVTAEKTKENTKSSRIKKSKLTAVHTKNLKVEDSIVVSAAMQEQKSKEGATVMVKHDKSEDVHEPVHVKPETNPTTPVTIKFEHVPEENEDKEEVRGVSVKVEHSEEESTEDDSLAKSLEQEKDAAKLEESGVLPESLVKVKVEAPVYYQNSTAIIPNMAALPPLPTLIRLPVPGGINSNQRWALQVVNVAKVHQAPREELNVGTEGGVNRHMEADDGVEVTFCKASTNVDTQRNEYQEVIVVSDNSSRPSSPRSDACEESNPLVTVEAEAHPPDSVTLETLVSTEAVRVTRGRTIVLGQHIWMGNPIDYPVRQVEGPGGSQSIQSSDGSDPTFSASSESDSSSEDEVRKGVDNKTITTVNNRPRVVPVQIRRKAKDSHEGLKFVPPICIMCPNPLVIREDPLPKRAYKFKCKDCQAQFYCNFHLNIHLDVHRYEHVCEECGSRFPAVSNQDIHYRYKHLPKGKRFWCRRCDINYYNEPNYNAHWKHCLTISLRKQHPGKPIVVNENDDLPVRYGRKR